jgi:hypothetical protein
MADESSIILSFQVRIVRRDIGTKVDIPSTDLVEQVSVLLDGIQVNLLETAKQKRDACIAPINTWDEFTAALNDKKLILAPWCDEEVFDVLTYTSTVPVCCYGRSIIQDIFSKTFFFELERIDFIRTR